MSTSNNAKFAFFYMLSLVALVFMSLATGMIIFQIINKTIADVLEKYSGQYNDGQMKFAISALIISAPIFYLVMRQIFKNLVKGDLDKDSSIRKWLTYFVLFVSSVVMIGWLIGTLNNFMSGELTAKFMLKALTAIGIAAAVFSFYFYDIKRDKVKHHKDRVVQIYLYGSLAVVSLAFVGSLFVVESPAVARNRRLDNAILDDFSQINSAINTYYQDKKVLPENLDLLRSDFNYINNDTLNDPKNNQPYGYHILADKKFELCADFLTANIGSDNSQDQYLKEQWPHEAGNQCISQTVWDTSSDKEGTPPVPAVPMR